MSAAEAPTPSLDEMLEKLFKELEGADRETARQIRRQIRILSELNDMLKGKNYPKPDPKARLRQAKQIRRNLERQLAKLNKQLEDINKEIQEQETPK